MTLTPTYGAVLVHGFTGSPFEMQLLRDDLQRAYPSLRIETPTLPGHGDDFARLAATGWPDWARAVETSVDVLRAEGRRVAVVGLSLGGLLTLELASRRSADLAAIVSLSAPTRLAPYIMAGTKRLRRGLLRNLMLPLLGGSDLSDLVLKKQNDARKRHRRLPVSALLALVDFMDYLAPRLKDVTAPLLLAHSRRDHTAPFDSMDFIATRVSSKVCERLILERSFHVITLDVERAQLFSRVRDHLDQYLFERSPNA